MINITESFWQKHLASTDGPMFHLVSTGTLDIQSLNRVLQKMGFVLFVIEAKECESELTLMDKFAESMHLPSYFGRNWNALLDLTRDLSWAKANGYLLLFSGAGNLLSSQQGVFVTLIELLEATVRDWRDERGEFGERAEPVAFHVIFVGDDGVKNSLLSKLTEPLCEHTGDAINVLPATSGHR